MNAPHASSVRDEQLARALILDEIFDFSLYTALQKRATGDLRKMLEDLAAIETTHVAFWKRFFGIEIATLDWRRRMKLRMMIFASRCLGSWSIHLILEAIEVHGIRKYLDLWDRHKGTPLGEAAREILNDEFHHEDQIVSEQAKRKINPERIRGIFLGFNDGLVEILGAVSGFFAAFQNTAMVLLAGVTVAVAGALSMAAGAFAAASSEAEVRRTMTRKDRFLGKAVEDGDDGEHPVRTALTVGISYFIGAAVPVLPVLLGATGMEISVAAGVVMIIFVSFILSFLSGMSIRKRILMNLVTVAVAVGVTSAIGVLANALWGVEIP